MKKMICRPAMRDGVKLLTWVELPGDGTGKYPAILSRNPYAPAPAADVPEVQENLPESYAAQNGFARVDQNCRGKGGSEGDFVPFHDERADGLDTIAWIEQQPWFDGRIYLTGGSYLGFVQLAMYEVLPPSVKGAFTAVMADDGRYTFFRNGVFKADLGPIWFPGVYHYQDLIYGSAHGSYDAEWDKNPMSTYMRRIYGYDVPAFNNIWYLRNDPMAMPDYFSQAFNCMTKLHTPMLMVTGWSEPFFSGTWRMWDKIPAGIKSSCAFVVGPWSHGCAVDPTWSYPFENGNQPRDLEMQWFLYLRDGKPMDNGVRLGAVNYYHVGKAAWECADAFPDEAQTKKLYLVDGGKLTDCAPADGSVTYRYDPLDPARFPGGPNSFDHTPNGFADQPEPNFRPDVKTFMTAPLTQDLTLAGKIAASFEVSTTAQATMFLIRVCCVQENGVATPMGDCPTELNPAAAGEKTTITFETDPLCWTLHKGERLRVDVMSSDAHSYRPHTNTRAEWLTAVETVVADNTVWFGNSVLSLPVRRG